MKNAMAFTALALFLAACAAPSTQAPNPTTARTPTSTLSITLTPSTTPSPTLTLTPSATPTPTVSVTPFTFFLMPSATSTPSRELDCQLLSQSPVNGSEFRPKEPFSVDWQITNTGAAGWNPGNVQFVFFGGTKLHLSPAVTLPRSVGPGQTVALDVSMRAPNKSSTYTTFWSLRRGTEYFCRVRVTIVVP